MLLYHEAHETRNWLVGWKLSPPIFSALFVIVLLIFAAIVDPQTITVTLSMLVAFSPVWLPIFLGVILFITWIHYARYRYWFTREYGLLEIQLPAEVTTSPSAMEVFLSSFWTTGGETTFLDRLWRGGFKSITSLEIASNEGRISFYVYALKVWHPAIEARLYGQYPEARVTAVDDYVKKVPFNLTDYEIWGAEYMKDNPLSPAPIKTYVDFELDKNTDTPEVRVDPLTNILELMNNVGKDQYLWYQIILRGHNKFDWYGIQEAKSRYAIEGLAEIQKIMKAAGERSKKVQGDLKEEGSNTASPTMSLTDGEREKVKSIETALSKNPFEVGIRVLYIAKKEKFHGIWGAYLFRLFQVFKSRANGLGGKPGRGMVQFDHPWEDFHEIRHRMAKRLLHFHYKYRAYFGVPYDQVPSIMSTEEVATLWHFPASNVKTPGLNRVPSKSSEAPINLPTLPQ